MTNGRSTEVSIGMEGPGSAVHKSGTSTSAGNPLLPPPPVVQQQYHPSDQFRPPKRWLPWLIPLIVVANIVMFIITMYVNNCPKNSISCIATSLGRFSFQPFKENPLLGPSSLTLEKLGALEVSKIVTQHQRWRLLTCIWLHAGVFHLLANMLSILFIGIRLEQEFGFVRIGIVYIISGIGGSLLSALFIQSNISVGASGALFGLLGAMLSELITNWTIYANKISALLSLIFLVAVNLAVGILPYVDNFAHIGGFISGFLLGFVFLIHPQYGWTRRNSVAPVHHSRPNVKKHKMYQYILWIISAVLLIVGFSVGFALLFRGYRANDHCSWCHYLSCVPTSKWNCKQTSAYCEISTDGFQTNLTCQDSGKSRSYPFPNPTSEQINSLCAQLCL